MAFETICGIALFPLLAVVLLLTYSRQPHQVMRLLVLVYARVWIWLVRPVMKLVVDGIDVRDFPRPSILVGNHLAFVDVAIMAMFWLPNHVICLRAWPFRIPFYRPFMRLAGYINVESRRWSALQDQCLSQLQSGACLIWYPEGHRSPDGRLGRYYSGTFRVAIASGAPIVPICITGTDTLWPRKRWWISPATVRLRALSPVYPEAYTGPKAHVRLRQDVKRLMSENIAEMRGRDD